MVLAPRMPDLSAWISDLRIAVQMARDITVRNKLSSRQTRGAVGWCIRYEPILAERLRRSWLVAVCRELE